MCSVYTGATMWIDYRMSVPRFRLTEEDLFFQAVESQGKLPASTYMHMHVNVHAHLHSIPSGYRTVQPD